MKYLKSIYCLAFGLCLILGFGFNATAQNFEGVIYYQFDEMQQNMAEIEYMIKDDKVRMQFGQGPQSGAMLFNAEEGKMTVIMNKMKSYMNMDLNEMAQDSDYDNKWEESAVNKTGQTKQVAGHNCEIWIVTDNNGDELSMCMADDLGTFMSPGNPMARQQAPDWAKEIVSEGFMPLEVIEASGSSETIQMKATKIEEKSLSNDLFEIPEGYRDMSSMMQQMMKQNNK